jgi:hypothetical protein
MYICGTVSMLVMANYPPDIEILLEGGGWDESKR